MLYRVKEYCIKKRLKWSDCAARNACKENEYYEDLVRHLRKNLAVCAHFVPSFLAPFVCLFVCLFYVFGDRSDSFLMKNYRCLGFFIHPVLQWVFVSLACFHFWIRNNA